MKQLLNWQFYVAQNLKIRGSYLQLSWYLLKAKKDIRHLKKAFWFTLKNKFTHTILQNCGVLVLFTNKAFVKFDLGEFQPIFDLNYPLHTSFS